MINIEKLNVVFNKNSKLENHVLKNINLRVEDGQFITVIGGNGAGKSTLMNVLAGNLQPNSGRIIIDNIDVTKLNPESRSHLVSRVFQDPLRGSFANLTIEENMAIAAYRGKRRNLKFSISDKQRNEFKDALSVLDIGLEDRLTDEVSNLSGGQRQALSLVMATFNDSKILLLDEHTAALDPKIAKKIMQITNKIIRKSKLTALMITHSMSQALEYGDRTIMLYHGKIIRDTSGEQRHSLSPSDLVKFFDL